MREQNDLRSFVPRGNAPRELTEAQHNRLDMLNPLATVIGWHPKGGPIIRYPDGHTNYINQHGKLKPVAQQYIKEAS